jgi:hypothetical protein
MQSMLKLLNYFEWRVFGHVGTGDALLVTTREMVEKARLPLGHVAGPFRYEFFIY